MNKLIYILLLTIGIVTACAYSITDIDISKSEPNCVRQCSTNYSSCVSQGNQIGFKTETLRACRESYAVCVQTCPAKQ
jgi:hypothetical protein